MIIGLSGKKRSGKSEVAKYLSSKLNIPVYSFAAPLKNIVYSVSGLTDFDKENNNYYDGKVFNLDVLRKELKKYKYLPLTDIEIDSLKAIEYYKISEIYRNLLQYIGTNIFRSRNENHWVLAFKEKYCLDNNFIVDDIRFLNEFLYINSLKNSKCVKIIREVITNDIHLSEVEMDRIRFKYKFENKYNTLVELYQQIDNYFDIK